MNFNTNCLQIARDSVTKIKIANGIIYINTNTDSISSAVKTNYVIITVGTLTRSSEMMQSSLVSLFMPKTSTFFVYSK